MCYVYVYIDPRNDIPFYIGAGKDKRDIIHLKEKHRKCIKNMCHFYNKLNKMQLKGIVPTVRRLIDNISREEAFNIWERFFISALGRQDLGTGPLCNHTNGGEGVLAPIRSLESRRKQAESLKANWNKLGVRKMMSEIQKEVQAKPEIKQQKSALALRAWADPIVRAKLFKAINKPEIRQMHSDRLKKLWANPETRQKLLVRRWGGPTRGNYKGVCKKCKGWRAKFTDKYLGTFKTELEAAKAYNDAVDKYWNGNGNGYKNKI